MEALAAAAQLVVAPQREEALQPAEAARRVAATQATAALIVVEFPATSPR